MTRVLETPLNPNTLDPRKMAALKKLFGMGNLDALMHSTQLRMKREWEESGSDEFLIFSSRQLGKTWFGLCTAISTCITQPGSRVLFYGPTKDKLKDIVNDTITPLMLFAPEGLIKRHKSEYRWTIGQSELRLCVLERAHVDTNRGINAKGLIVIEEGCFVDADAWNYAYSSVIDAQRLRHSPKVLINTTPSDDELHPVHTVLLPMLEAKGATARYTIYDNPHLSDEKIDEIRTRMPEDSFKREYLAEICRSEASTVIPEFDTRKHRASLVPPPYAHWILSVDQGGSLDPTGITLSYYDHTGKKFCVYREKILPTNTPCTDVIAACRELEGFVTKGHILKLSDAPGAMHTEYAHHQYPMTQPAKPNGSFDANIQALRVAMQLGEFVIDESCQETVRQLISGQYNKQRTDFKRSQGSHLDALASILYSYRYKNESNPYPAHYFGSPSTHYMHNAPQQASLENAFNKLGSIFGQ